MRTLLLLFFAVFLGAIDIECTVIRVADGDTLTVGPVPGLPPEAKRGKEGDVYVRLLCVDTLEIWDETKPKSAVGFAARDLLASIAGKDVVVVLSDAGRALSTDRYGRILAFVRAKKDKRTAQEQLILAGFTAYWRKWRDAPAPLHDRLIAAEAQARADNAGAWRTQPELMIRKSSERPR